MGIKNADEVVADRHGHVYVLAYPWKGNDLTIYRWISKKTWKAMPGSGAIKLAVDNQNRLILSKYDGTIYRAKEDKMYKKCKAHIKKKRSIS